MKVSGVLSLDHAFVLQKEFKMVKSPYIDEIHEHMSSKLSLPLDPGLGVRRPPTDLPNHRII
jgi:hypothetical protein